MPDEQNLAMAPLFVRAFRYKVNPATGLLTFDPQHYDRNPTARLLENLPYGDRVTNIDEPRQHGDWHTGHPVDLVAWQTLDRRLTGLPQSPQPGGAAEDVLLALSPYGPLLDELAQAAAERPLARWPLDYTQRPTSAIGLPHVNIVQRLEKTLRLRACARLTLGQSAAARRDVELMFRLDESLVGEPTVISALVRSSGVDLILQAVWEGLKSRQWSADDMEMWQGKLRGVNLLSEFQRGLRGGERAEFLAQLPDELQQWSTAREMQRIVPLMNGQPINGTTRWLWFFLPILPRGWYAQNAADSSRWMQAGLIDALDPVNGRVMPARIEHTMHHLFTRRITPYNFLTAITLPVYRNIPLNVAAAQSAAEQAMAACALERYYLDHHIYPDHLDALVPAYLEHMPRDILDGEPLRYRLTSDGRYQLYSVGWDGKDDGGSLEWPADRRWRGGAAGGPPPFPRSIKDRGDWVWQYAPAEPPDPPANRSRLE